MAFTSFTPFHSSIQKKSDQKAAYFKIVLNNFTFFLYGGKTNPGFSFVDFFIMDFGWVNVSKLAFP